MYNDVDESRDVYMTSILYSCVTAIDEFRDRVYVVELAYLIQLYVQIRN